MKKLAFLFATAIGTATVSYSQLSISGSFNLTSPGLYYTIGPDYTWHHHRVGGGINLNQSFSSGLEHDLKWNLKPHDASEAFGLNAYYSYVFYPENSELEPYVFFDMNYQYCGLRNAVAFVDGDAGYNFSTDPIHTFTETIGIGFTADIYKSLYLNVKGGLGLSQQAVSIGSIDPSGSSATYKISLGLGYRFGEWSSE